MTIALPSLADLDPALVAASIQQVIASVQEDSSGIDLTRGAFAALLARFSGMLQAQLQTLLNDYLNARSLLWLNQNPALADQNLVADVLANYLLVAQQGASATGEVTVVINSDTTTTIAAGTTWTGNGQTFTNTLTYTGKVDEAHINGPGDRLIVVLPGGNFAFTVPVTATQNGTAGNITNNTVVTPSITPINYVTSYAASDFSGGLTADSNQTLLNLLSQGIPCKAPSNRSNMAAMLRGLAAFANVGSMSIIGMGDPEMLRDRHWIFPVSGGGRADWYVRTQQTVFAQSLTKTATLVGQDSNGNGIWQFSLSRDDAPGFYQVTGVQLAARQTSQVAGYVISSDVRGLDLSGTGFVPDIVNTLEGAYTRYQTAVIQFVDTDTSITGLAALATQQYVLTALCLPLLSDIQDTLSQRDSSSYGADILIKAPVPCFVQLNLTVNIQSGDPTPDSNGIINALCAAVNTLGFTGQLYASQLHDIVYSFLRGNQTVSTIDMLGTITCPDLSKIMLRSNEVLLIPNNPALMTTPRTVQFFLSAADVIINVVTSVPVNV